MQLCSSLNILWHCFSLGLEWKLTFSSPVATAEFWQSPDGNTKIRLIIFFAAEDGEALYVQQKQDRELTGSDHELLIPKFRLKLKTAGKTTRPFRYDLNQIPYDYTVEVRKRFKGLDLIDRSLINYGQRFVTLYRRQWSRPSPRKRNAKRQNGCLRGPYN